MILALVRQEALRREVLPREALLLENRDVVAVVPLATPNPITIPRNVVAAREDENGKLRGEKSASGTSLPPSGR